MKSVLENRLWVREMHRYFMGPVPGDMSLGKVPPDKPPQKFRPLVLRHQPIKILPLKDPFDNLFSHSFILLEIADPLIISMLISQS
jgi:hypothetical protein